MKYIAWWEKLKLTTKFEKPVQKTSTRDSCPACRCNDEDFFLRDTADDLMRVARILDSAAETLNRLISEKKEGTSK